MLLVHNNTCYWCIHFHFRSVDYAIKIFFFSRIFFCLYKGGQSCTQSLHGSWIYIYIYIYIIINFVYLLLHEEIWLHIIHYFKKLHISNQGCKDRFILGFITFRDPAWNTTQKNSHKWSHLIRYGWCDEFISFVTYIICWYKSFSHSWWQLHVRTSKKQKFF